MTQVNGFFEHVKKHHTRSIIMFAGFAISVQLAFGALLSVLGPMMHLPFIPEVELIMNLPYLLDRPLDYIKTVSPYIFVISLGLFIALYYAHTAITKAATGFIYIRQHENQRLYNITHYLSITAGIPMPNLAVIPNAALNAFACGRTPQSATLVVTQGLLHELNDDELRAVIAHEITHIVNGDLDLMAMANASQGLIKFVNWVNPMQIRNGKRTPLLLLVLPIALPLLIIMAMVGFVMKLSTTLASVTRYFISSSREFIADADAVRLTHNPAALISALSKIEGRSQISGVDKMTHAMMIDGAAEGEFATHPPIQERIETLRQYAGSMVHGAASFTDTRSFGQRRPASTQTMQTAQYKYRQKTKAPLLKRLDAGSKTNIIGFPKEATAVLLVILLVFLGMNVSMRRTVSNMESTFNAPLVKTNKMKPIITMSPAFVTLDLDGRGLMTRRLSGSQTYFEMRAGKPAHQTGWLGSDEGFLFHDANKNKKMDGLSELITTRLDRAVQNKDLVYLNRFDSNRDGKISARDHAFKDLMVWQDYGSDGVAERDEIYPLSEYGITSISLKASELDGPEGRVVASRTKLLRKADIVINSKTSKRRTLAPPILYMTAFQTDLTRFKNAAGDIITKDQRQTRPVSRGLEPAYGDIAEAVLPLRGAK